MSSIARFVMLFYQSNLSMAEQQSNAVLSVIDQQTFTENCKYPQGYLNFAGDHWQSYYHSHPSSGRPSEEHGHFHLFYRPGSETESDWSHVICLSADAMGQALQWSLVNQWVTAGDWLSHEQLKLCLDSLCQLRDDSFAEMQAVEVWLLSLLALFREQIEMMYEERDALIRQMQQEKTMPEILQDRSVYGLVRQPLNLQERLSHLMTGD